MQSNSYKIHWWPLALLVLLLGSSCRQVTIELKEVPANTPRGAQIYVAGNFNNWNPGDPNYVLKYDEKDSLYRVTLPMGIGRLRYKFTRGDWTTVETDVCGGILPDRELTYDKSKKLLVNKIFSWHDMEPEDCGQVTLVLDKLPPNTPQNDSIYLTGPFSGWLNKRSDFRFRKDSAGRYIFTFNRTGKEKEFEFNINRGSWEKAEVGRYGAEIKNRKLVFGQGDTLYCSIENWNDLLIKEENNFRVIVIDKLPPYTPKNADIYFAGTLNNWNPFDKTHRFSKAPNGKWFFVLPIQTNEEIKFKVTRGGWETEEVDANFRRIEDRTIGWQEGDTIKIEVKNWIDFAENRNGDNLLIKLNKIPAYTPKNQRIYLTGTFNNWVENDRNYRFKIDANGKYYIQLQNVRESFEYKITLGSWDAEEVNQWYNRPANRVYRIGSEDTVLLNIENWLSIP